MSLASRRRRRSLIRRGEPYYRSNPWLPPAQERVQRSLALEALSRVLPDLEASYRDPGVYQRSRSRVFYPPVSLAKQREALRPSGLYTALSDLSVRVPRKVAFCVRRQARREVMFAFRIAGRRGIGRGGSRRTQDSQYSCGGR